MLQQHDGGLACANGCGEWIPNAVVESLLGTLEIAGLAPPGPFQRASPLPATRCPTCRAALDDSYVELPERRVLTLGRCALHGIWIEAFGRAQFEQAFASAIAKQRERSELGEAMRAGDPAVARILERLQARIEELEERVVVLERRVRYVDL